jgi:DNA-binding helix-hairpin-helix protein with protein kinase domain
MIQLGRRIGTGAEGEVYEIQDKSDLVVKVYHETPPPEKAEKLVALSRLGNERLFNLSAWPVSTLLDAPDGEVAGFVMKKIGDAEEVHTLHSPKSRLQKFPEASWAFLIYVAANMARAVAAIHEHGLVIGDVNPKNILVTRKATVYLLDVDSFQFSVDGRTYRCEGGFPEYTPPELQGVAFREVDREQEHDCFGLAVVIFQLLFLGRHPYSGRYLGAGEMPLERAINESRFAYGDDANSRKMRQPPGALALDSMPPALIDLFRRAFLTTNRPGPREWVERLDELSKALKKCYLHSGHYYYRELRECPWCGIEKQARVRLFNFLLPGDDTQRGHFRLDEVWNEISRAEPPSSPMIKWEEILKPPILSAEVAAHAQDRRISLIKALILSIVAGLAISFAPFPVFLILLIIVGRVACEISKAGMGATAGTTVQLLFQNKQPVQDDPLLEKVHARLQQAEEAAQQLDQQYNLECGNSRWGAVRDELRNQKETYENLAHIRQSTFHQLEAEAKKNQLEEFLDQFKIDDSEIRGIVPPIKAALLSHGVETAADVSDEVEWIPSVGSAQAERLLDWRRGLEQKFVFDPAKGVPSEARVRTERELDALRLRLESDLISGAHSLHLMKHEIEASRQRLWPALTQAHQDLAQAGKDLKVASRRNPAWLIIAALVIAFLIGIATFSSPRTDYVEVPREDSGIQPDTAPAPANWMAAEQKEHEIAQEALNYYRQGLALSQDGKFADAVTLFQEAVRIDMKFNEAYEELGYALYRLGRYEESANASNQATNIRNSFRPYYNMGLAYMA